MSADSSAAAAPVSTPAAPSAPVSERTAFAVLGTMLLLIVALTVVLIQSTWVESASAAQPPVADGASLAQR